MKLEFIFCPTSFNKDLPPFITPLKGAQRSTDGYNVPWNIHVTEHAQKKTQRISQFLQGRYFLSQISHTSNTNALGQEVRGRAEHSNLPHHAEFSDPFISYPTTEAFPAVPAFRHVIDFLSAIAVLLECWQISTRVGLITFGIFLQAGVIASNPNFELDIGQYICVSYCKYINSTW
jgi:hypothetical protein